MPFHVEKMTDMPVVMVLQSGSQVVQEMPAILEQLIPLLDEQSGRVFLVMDMRAIAIGLDDLTIAANKGAGGPGTALHHPSVIETLLLTDDGLIRLAAQGMRTVTFGGTKIRVFETPEQAIDYCQERIAEITGELDGAN